MYSRLVFLAATASCSTAASSVAYNPKPTDWGKVASDGFGFGVDYADRAVRGSMAWVGSAATNLGAATQYYYNPATLPLAALKPKDMKIKLKTRIAHAESYLAFMTENPDATLGNLDVEIANQDIKDAEALIAIIERLARSDSVHHDSLNSVEGAHKANSYSTWILRKKTKPVEDFASPYVTPAVDAGKKWMSDIATFGADAMESGGKWMADTNKRSSDAFDSVIKTGSKRKADTTKSGSEPFAPKKGSTRMEDKKASATAKVKLPSRRLPSGRK